MISFKLVYSWFSSNGWISLQRSLFADLKVFQIFFWKPGERRVDWGSSEQIVRTLLIFRWSLDKAARCFSKFFLKVGLLFWELKRLRWGKSKVCFLKFLMTRAVIRTCKLSNSNLFADLFKVILRSAEVLAIKGYLLQMGEFPSEVWNQSLTVSLGLSQIQNFRLGLMEFFCESIILLF